MIDESLFKVNHIGKDGFIWWIGQVAPAKSWKADALNNNFSDPKLEKKNWPGRCKVRIVGYHSFRKADLEDKDLPWAHIMIDPAFGSGQGGEGTTTNLTGGETCFGFFLDGDDAQQPVIVGLLYRHRDVKNFPEDRDFAFGPFSGQPNPNNIPSIKRPSLENTPPGESPQPPQGLSSKIESNPDIKFVYNNGLFNLTGIGTTSLNYGAILDSGIADKFELTGVGDTLWSSFENFGGAAFFKLATFTYTPPNPCRNNFIGQITQILQDFIGFTNGLQKYANSYIDPILNEVVDIGESIKSVAGSIVGVIRFIINGIRGGLIKCITYLFKKYILKNFIPAPQQGIVAQSAKTILDKLYCLFEKLIPTLLDYIEGLLTDMIDSVFAAPICAIEQWTAGILTNVMTTIEESIDVIISGVSWLTGGLSKVFDVLNQASSIASQIYNFLGCDELKCTTPSKWVSNFGNIETSADNWQSMVDKVNVVKGVADGLGSIESAIGEFAFYGQGTGSLDCNSRVNNPRTQDDLATLYPGTKLKICIPPIISVVNGSTGGMGAKLIPIIGPKGQITGAKIASKGFGYKSAPVLTVIDNSGHGRGAILRATIDKDGSIEDVVVKESGRGYCATLPYDDKEDDSNLDDPDLGDCSDTSIEPKDLNYTLSLSSSSNRVIEGNKFTVTVSSTNIKSPKKVEYNITGVNKEDINQKLNGVLEFEEGNTTIEIETIANASRK